MSEILSAETMASWRQRHLDHGLAISTYTRVIDSHEALRKRVEELEAHHRLHHSHSHPQTFGGLPHEYPPPVRPDWDDVTDTAVAEKHREEAEHV